MARPLFATIKAPDAASAFIAVASFLAMVCFYVSLSCGPGSMPAASMQDSDDGSDEEQEGGAAGEGPFENGGATGHDDSLGTGGLAGEAVEETSNLFDAGLEGVGALDSAAEVMADARPRTESLRSAGCGRVRTGTSSYVEQPRLSVAGLSRQYYLFVPRTYAPDRAYPLVFRWHGAGGTALGGGIPIEAATKEDAIVVAAHGHNVPPFGNGWDFAENGPDVALFDDLVARLGESHCIDRSRIYSYGFSMGGGFSLVLGCVRGLVLRGIGVVAGGWLAPAPRPRACTGHVAAWVAQGTADRIVTAAHVAEIRNDVYLPQHGCMATSRAVSPAPCRSFDGCLAGHPQVYCEGGTGHDVQAGFAPAAAWAFWKALPDAEP